MITCLLTVYTFCVRLGSVSAFFSSRFLLFFSLFLPAFVDFGRQYLLLWIVHILFTYCAYTVYVLKNIKNGSYDTIYIFKNYFATVFQFSVFSNNKFNPNTPFMVRKVYAYLELELQMSDLKRDVRWGLKELLLVTL